MYNAVYFDNMNNLADVGPSLKPGNVKLIISRRLPWISRLVI
jgi:hypothetical protein